MDTLLNLSEDDHHAEFLHAGAQINETYYLEGKLRGLHDVGKVGERWYVNVMMLGGAISRQLATEVKLGPLRNKFSAHRANVGMIGRDGDFRVHLTGLDHRAVRFMREKLLTIKVFNSDSMLEVKNVSEDLVMDRHRMGPLEFTLASMQKNQCVRPNAHIFASLYLKSAAEMDPEDVRSVTDHLVWNPDRRMFEIATN